MRQRVLLFVSAIFYILVFLRYLVLTAKLFTRISNLFLSTYFLPLSFISRIYLPYLPYLSPQAQLLAPALVRRRVLRPVLPAAVRRHLALPAHDIDICSFLAPRVVADTSQLLAQTLVLGHVPHTVVLAAVYGRSAVGTLLEPFAELQVRGARLACRVVASSGVPLCSLGFYGEVGIDCLSCAVRK